MLKKYLATILFIGWMVLITSLSLFSFSQDDEDTVWFPHLDKVVHFTFHFVIVFLGAFFLNEIFPNKFSKQKGILGLLVFSFVYGCTIEGLQYILPYNRSAEFWDVLANSVGGLVGGLLIYKCSSLIGRIKWLPKLWLF